MAACAPGMAFMRNVYLIYKEALHNVARHASARNVTIDIGVERGRLVMRIRDDGRGFDEGTVRAGRGLENMRRRARQIGGDLEIESDAGAGTRMTFSARIP
jgi:signal transduction histidine kinase